MKYFTLAVLLGAVSASQLYEVQDAVDSLKIRISKAGQRAIEDEAQDIPETIEKIKDSKPVRNLKSSLERFAHTKEVANLKKLDQKFLASPEGKRLVAEWKDVGEVLKANLKHEKDGVHFANEHMDELSDELNDVAHQYEKLDGSKWDKAYEAGWKAALSTKQAKSVGRRFKTFKTSEEGQMLKKEIQELKAALHQHVKVSDVPDSWKMAESLADATPAPADAKKADAFPSKFWISEEKSLAETPDGFGWDYKSNGIALWNVYRGKYLFNEKDDPAVGVSATNGNLDWAGHWYPESLGNGEWAFKSYGGKYLTCKDPTILTSEQEKIDDAATFTVYLTDEGANGMPAGEKYAVLWNKKSKHWITTSINTNGSNVDCMGEAIDSGAKWQGPWA